MKRNFVITVITAAALFLIAGCSTVDRTEGRTEEEIVPAEELKPAEQEEKNAVEKLDLLTRQVLDFYKEYEAAWTRNDFDALMNLYTEDYSAGYDEEQLYMTKQDLEFISGELLGLKRGFHDWRILVTVHEVRRNEAGVLRARIDERYEIDGVLWRVGNGIGVDLVETGSIGGGLAILREIIPEQNPADLSGLAGVWSFETIEKNNGISYQLTIGFDHLNNIEYSMEYLVMFRDDQGNDLSGWIPYGRYGGTLYAGDAGESVFILAPLYAEAAEFDLEEQIIFGDYGPRSVRGAPEFRQTMYSLFPDGSNIYNPAFRYEPGGRTLTLHPVPDKGGPLFPAEMEFNRIE